MTTHREKIINASPELAQRWCDLRAALDDAAMAHGVEDGLPLPSDQALLLPGAEAELDRAINAVKGRTVAGSFEQSGERLLKIRLTWEEPA